VGCHPRVSNWGTKDKTCPLQRVIAMEIKINVKISGGAMGFFGGLFSLLAAIITAL
jgi:hypothetical protein